MGVEAAPDIGVADIHEAKGPADDGGPGTTVSLLEDTNA